MVFDRECMFLDAVSATALPTMSDVVVNGAGGGAGNNVFLFASVNGGAVGESGNVALETSDTESFASSVEVLKCKLEVGKPVSVRLPVGLKKYLRLKPTGSFTKGKVTAGLVCDVVVTSEVFK